MCTDNLYESVITLLHPHMYDLVAHEVLPSFTEVSIARHSVSMSTLHREKRGRAFPQRDLKRVSACIMAGSMYSRVMLGRCFMPALRKGAVLA